MSDITDDERIFIIQVQEAAEKRTEDPMRVAELLFRTSLAIAQDQEPETPPRDWLRRMAYKVLKVNL